MNLHGRSNTGILSLLLLVFCALFAPEARAQVQIFQHCDFGGWTANFSGTGNFNLADLQSRGGINNDASSIKVAPGFRVTLFSGDNQTFRSIVKTADDSCLVDDSFNDVLTSLRI
jgi:chitinase